MEVWRKFLGNFCDKRGQSILLGLLEQHRRLDRVSEAIRGRLKENFVKND